MATLLFLLLYLLGGTVALNNGLAYRPPMGWSPFNVYGCDTTQDNYETTASILYHSGLQGLGYQFMVMDCGWQSSSRTPSGTLYWNETRFPDGIPAMSRVVHGYGLFLGLYSTAGYYSCDLVGGWAHWPGSLGFEGTDAATFAEWNADYLKYSNCFTTNPNDFLDFNPPISEQDRFTVMRDAIAGSGHKLLYSIDEWGVQDPARWAGLVGNSWRISNNIERPPSFESLRRIINQLVPITQFAGHEAWNDLDLLEVGNAGLTQAEWGTQFAFWAAAKQVISPSPLIISTDLGIIPDEAMFILGVEGIIAVNQDSLGQSISFKRRYTDNYDVWAGPLANDSMVALLVNWASERQAIPFYLSDVGLVSADITDLWTGNQLRTGVTEYTDSTDPHGTLIYKLSNVVLAAPNQYTNYSADSPSNVLAGGASLKALSNGVNVVGNIGYGGTLTFLGVDGGSNGGTKLLSLSYVNADFVFYNTDCSNCRRAEVSVNGGTPVSVEFPLSGQSWDILFSGYLISLDGFVPGTHNNITFANRNAWAPDMQSIGVQV